MLLWRGAEVVYWKWRGVVVVESREKELKGSGCFFTTELHGGFF
jgi:hypothetical protein